MTGLFLNFMADWVRCNTKYRRSIGKIEALIILDVSSKDLNECVWISRVLDEISSQFCAFKKVVD